MINLKELATKFEKNLIKEGKEFSLEVQQDFEYDYDGNFKGQYSVNGKKKKTEDDSSLSAMLLKDISKVVKVNANKVEDWVDKKFGFEIGRLEYMKISGEVGKPNTWSGEATELN